MARGTPTVALIALIALVAVATAACAGEVHDVRGDLKRPYAALVIADAVVASGVEVAGEESVTLTLAAAEAVDAAESRADDVARRSTVDAVTFGVELDDGAVLQVYLGRWSDDALQVSYAVDPATDLPVAGFGGDLPDGTGQREALDCLADSYGTGGEHRRADALRLDVLAPTEERLLGGCLERLQEW
ncbi:MAG: hypothetical protein ACLGHM_01690 [Actinomycetes bacterium]|jgi:hypothetical protein